MSVHPHNEFDKTYQNFTPGQLKSVVDGASARTQKLDTSGDARVSDGNLKDMKVAQAGLKAMVSAGVSQGADRGAALPSGGGSSLGKRLLVTGLISAGTGLAGAALGLPSLGLVGLGLDAARALHAPAPGPMASTAPGHPSRNFRPVVHKASEGYFDAPGSGGRKGSHHIGSAKVATPTAGSFAEQSDVARGISSPARTSPKVAGPNVFEEKFASMSFTREQHRSNERNLAKVEQQIANTKDLIAKPKMDAKEDGVLTDKSWGRMDNDHKRNVLNNDGMMSLADTGTVSRKAIKSFTEFEVKTPQVAQLAPTLG